MQGFLHFGLCSGIRERGGIWFAVSETGSGNCKVSGPCAVKLGENAHIALASRLGLSRTMMAEC